jgi:hypothetical protein
MDDLFLNRMLFEGDSPSSTNLVQQAKRFAKGSNQRMGGFELASIQKTFQ